MYLTSTMELLSFLVDFILHIDVHLDELIQNYGALTYLILFLIVFCETGLVVTPFLPGDSLLFAAGAFAGRGSLDLVSIAALIFIAAVLGDAVNYHVGAYLGIDRDRTLIKRAYLERTQAFYEKYGGKAIIFARFVPIVRTFAPFLAGVGAMKYKQFFTYNVIGALLWVALFVGGGYMFGEIPAVKKNFTLVIMAIIVLSIIPPIIEVIKARRKRPVGSV